MLPRLAIAPVAITASAVEYQVGLLDSGMMFSCSGSPGAASKGRGTRGDTRE
jgi:hypothetical protein